MAKPNDNEPSVVSYVISALMLTFLILGTFYAIGILTKTAGGDFCIANGYLGEKPFNYINSDYNILCYKNGSAKYYSEAEYLSWVSNEVWIKSEQTKYIQEKNAREEAERKANETLTWASK